MKHRGGGDKVPLSPTQTRPMPETIQRATSSCNVLKILDCLGIYMSMALNAVWTKMTAINLGSNVHCISKMRCHFRFAFIWTSSSPYSRIWQFWHSEITIHMPAKLHIVIAAKMHSWLETDFQSALIVNQCKGWPFPCYWYYRTIKWQIFPEPAFAYQIYQLVQLTKYGIQGYALENPSMLPMLKIGIIVKSRDCGTFCEAMQKQESS